MVRHACETSSLDLLKNPWKNGKKKTKGQLYFLIKAETKNHLKQNQDSHVEELGGRYTGKTVSPQGIEPTPLRSSPSFSWAQAHHPMHSENVSRTPHEIENTPYRNRSVQCIQKCHKISKPKTDIKRRGSARRKASWLLVESLEWKVCWWSREFFHLCGHSANLPERID